MAEASVAFVEAAVVETAGAEADAGTSLGATAAATVARAAVAPAAVTAEVAVALRSRTMTTSQWDVSGKRSTGIAVVSWNGAPATPPP